MPNLTQPCEGNRSVGAGSRSEPGACSLSISLALIMHKCTHVVIPEEMRMTTNVQVAVMPMPDEKDRYRKGMNEVGTTLRVSQMGPRGCQRWSQFR